MNETLEQITNEAIAILPPSETTSHMMQVSRVLPAITLEEASQRYQMLVSFVKEQLRESIDYGVIPGTGDKRTLLKPGAEKLCTFFGLRPILKLIEKVEDWTGFEHDGEPFFYYAYVCELYRGDVLIASTEASCNSWEKKYRYRQGQLTCPVCNKQTVFKSKNDDGYYCWKKKDGCGTTFRGNDPDIKSQKVGRVANEDIFDQVNTIRKMAQKRALVGTTIVAANASEFFTQDLEDLTGWQIQTQSQEIENYPANVEPAIEFPRDPIAKSVPDLVTAKQLSMIYALARELGINHEEECQSVLGCNTDELSKRAASSLIEHLQKLSEEAKAKRQKKTSQPAEEPSPQEKQEEPKPKQENSTAEMREKRGQGITSMGLVSYKDNVYQVTSPSLRGRNTSYQVWKDNGRIYCSCLEFEENSKDVTYKCEHIYAVKAFAVSQMKEKPQSQDEQTQQDSDGWLCTRETRERIEAAIKRIAEHENKNAMSKDDLLLALREKYERDDVPHGLSEAEAAAVAFSFERYIADLDAEIEDQRRLQSNNQGNNRGNAKRK